MTSDENVGMQRKWRVAILGLGHWYSAFNLARALPEYPRAELVAAWWHHPMQLAAFSSRFGIRAHTRLRISDLKTRIEAGEIGDIAVLHQTCRWSIAEDWASSGRPGWFADPVHVPGGAFIDEGIYWIDVFRWLTGSEITQVEGKIANLVHKDIAVEDWGFGTFTFANGVVATLEAAWTINAPRKTGPSPKQNAVVRLEIVGTRGEIIDQWFRSPGRAAGAADWVFERQSEARFAATSPVVLDHLIDCLEDRAKPIATIRDARASFVAAMAVYEAARTGRAISFASA